jgi:class 3 adenylate cyclase
MLVIIHDIVRTAWTGLGVSVELYPYAMVIWILAEASGLMARFYRTFSQVELLSDELGEANFELQETESAIVRFVPFDFLRLLGKGSIRDVDAGDRARAQMTVLRCGFSFPGTRSTSATPETEFDLMSRTIARAEPIIQHRGGFVNEFRGDGFEAFFSGDPADAVLAALQIVEGPRSGARDGDGGSARESDERRQIEFAIGIDSGAVVVGTVGGRQHIMRGVFGEPIEVAQCLEREAHAAGVGILISEATNAALGETGSFETRPVGSVRIEGPNAEVNAFEVVPRVRTDSAGI